MVDSKCWRYFMVLHRMVIFRERSIYAQRAMERSADGSYLVCAEGPPFLAIGPMDKNVQLHWTFRWSSCPVFNNSAFCVLWPSNAISAVLRKVVLSRNRRSAEGSRSFRHGWASRCLSAA